MTKTLKRIIVGVAIALLFYFPFGFFIVQPIGALPEGSTILYFRFGLKVSFITSADGILLSNNQDVSLLGRMVILGKFGEVVDKRKIVSLPYSKTMYSISTGRKEFEK